MMHLSPEILTGQSAEHIQWLEKNQGLHKDVVPAWLELVNAAKSNGFELSIASAYRDFDRQLYIWNNKFSGKTPIKNKDNGIFLIDNLTPAEIIHAILLYSALPGSSRHHWGTEIDVYAKNLLPKNKKLQLEPWEYQEGGYFHSFSCWLKSAAPQYGFTLPYNEYRGGVAAEPWHISFSAISNTYQKACSLDILISTIEKADISGKDSIIELLPDIYQQYIINIGS